MTTSRKKPKSSSQSNKLNPVTSTQPAAQWGNVTYPATTVVPASSSGMVFSNSSLVPATSGYAKINYPNNYTENGTIKNINDENYYSIDINRSNQGAPPSYSTTFYSEEEFVFSFVTLYNDMQSGKKFSTTSNSIIDIQTLTGIKLVQNINGVKLLLSPFYVLKRAKELKYEKA
jgi:hypothetical protein